MTNVAHIFEVECIALVSEKQRRIIYHQEMSKAAETAKALVEGMRNTASDFITATHIEHAKAMFKVRIRIPKHCIFLILFPSSFFLPLSLSLSLSPDLMDTILGCIQRCPERRGRQ